MDFIALNGQSNNPQTGEIPEGRWIDKIINETFLYNWLIGL